jgi:hypothetical protein
MLRRLPLNSQPPMAAKRFISSVPAQQVCGMQTFAPMFD